ncbi:MAG TPA: alpha/beta fold hydrolase [Vicinamibacterales bacterium]|nr:alpha/beta fold hydrolase [Vicinamibacterales bacterium]
MKSLKHFTWRFAVVAALLAAVGLPSAAAAQTAASHTFRVFVRGVDTGIEEVTLLESVDGWTLRGSGKLRAPVNISMDHWEARYDRAWKPIELTINLTESAKQWTVRTTFNGTIASSDISQDGQVQRRSSTVAADTIVLPNLIFGAYEALAARLAVEKPGSQLQVFIAPQDALAATIEGVTDETIKVASRTIAARRWKLHMGGGAAKLEMEVWTEGRRLLRLDIPTQMLTVLRDDIATVAARLVTLARPNDEEVSIPANGFSLAATISRPVAAQEPPPAPGRKPVPVRLPAVVLVSGSSPTDRDEFVAGIPIFAQLATALADAGYLVVRYDERGAGQSGGRQESATIDEFAVDVRAVVNYLMKRRDVDPKRVSLIGYAEGGWIAMLVAAREQKIAAVALIATPSTPGTELVLEQQRLLFERGGTSGAVQQAAVDQQKKILEAVITGKGWENFNPEVRQRVDTPLYRSFLMFEPAQTIAKVRQPMLVVQPMLDREVPAYHGEQLAQLARSRPRAKPAEFVQLPGVNHLLARATTGEIAEYGTLPQRSVSAAATLELIAWLAKALAPEPQK